jgi:RNA polymerase sigma-70 factor (ECF subfamily)
MTAEHDFADFLERVRAGDEQAATELVRKYEPVLRREVRMRLRSAELRRLLDSLDVSQSVLASFFVRAAAGQFDLSSSQALRRLLVRMARNKLATQARRIRTSSGTGRRVHSGELQDLDQAATGPGPGQIVAARDLLGTVLHHLTDEERRLADLRAAGQSWLRIASAVGGTAGSRRKQLARALERIARGLRLEQEF